MNIESKGIVRITQHLVGAVVLAVVLNAHTGYAAGIVRTGIVQTQDGPIRGSVSEGVRRFLGIPFAAPPVGDLRWRPPQQPTKWNNPKDTVKFGNACPQTEPLAGFAAKSDTEDCLYLNVFAPKETNKDLRPVMVWIYGGGYYAGQSNDYDGGKLVRQGDVVVVTINYRLNVFGFLAVPALDNEGHMFSNYGIMDQQFALKWVQKNIAAFGGDPNNVTIFGESSGGRAVWDHMISPLSKGLFHRAISHSGSMDGQYDLAAIEKKGVAFAKAVGCVNATASCLRGLSVQEIQSKAGKFNKLDYVPIDGAVITQTRQAAFESGNFNRVPVINGTNKDENRWKVALKVELIKRGPPLTEDQYPALIKKKYEGNAPKVLAEYPFSNYSTASEALSAAQGDSGRICSELRVSQVLSRYVPVFVYEVADRTMPSYLEAASFPLGAYHTGEIQYIFPLYRGASGTPHALNPLQERLSDIMVKYWTTFAKSGNPNSSTTPNWPQYTTKDKRYQSLKPPEPVALPISAFIAAHKCDFWKGLK